MHMHGAAYVWYQDLESFNYTLAPPALCPPECVPSQYALKEYINRTGPFMSEVISTCAMSTTQCSRCERRSQNMTIFPGSPYERTVDRGICNGRCEGILIVHYAKLGEFPLTHAETGESCVAVKSRTLSLENSNGYYLTITIYLHAGYNWIRSFVYTQELL